MIRLKKNLYEATVYGVGFMGEGPYKSKVNGKSTREYNIWHSMMDRCYNEKHSDRYPTYKDCTVCEEWHNFQTFCSWFDNNFREIPGEKMALDKDILIKGNKVYGPDTCVFVPKKINSLFVKSDASRSDLPIGVQQVKSGKYQASVSINGKDKKLGRFNTKEEAFEMYKKAKEQHIKDVAEQYKDRIPKSLYDAMYNYEVDMYD